MNEGPRTTKRETGIEFEKHAGNGNPGFRLFQKREWELGSGNVPSGNVLQKREREPGSQVLEAPKGGQSGTQ